MATQHFQYIDDILKEWYAPAIVNQVYVKSPVWSQVKKTSKGVAGKRVYIPLRHTLTEAVGANRATVYTLPTANRVQYDATFVWQKRNYGRVQVDGLAIEASKGKGGWIDAFSGETQGIAESFAIEVDQQVMGRGTGILGVVDGAHGTSVTTIGIDNPHGITEATPAYSWMRVGMQLEAWDISAGSYIAVYPLVDGVTPSSQQFTITVKFGSTLADGDFITRKYAGSFTGTTTSTTIIDAKNSGAGAIMGIDRIIDSDRALASGSFNGDDIDSFQGINASGTNNSWWRAYVDTDRGILTETKIQEDLDGIEQNTDGTAPNLALTTYALRNKLIEIVRSDRMITSLNLVGGWEAIKYRGASVSLPIMVHKFCPTGYMYYLNLKHLKYYTLKSLTWDKSGGGIIKPKTDEDQYEAWFKMYGNLATDKRNALGKVTGYTTS